MNYSKDILNFEGNEPLCDILLDRIRPLKDF